MAKPSNDKEKILWGNKEAPFYKRTKKFMICFYWRVQMKFINNNEERRNSNQMANKDERSSGSQKPATEF